MSALYSIIIGMAIAAVGLKAFSVLVQSCEDRFGVVLGYAGLCGFSVFAVFLTTIDLYYWLGFAMAYIPLAITLPFGLDLPQNK